MRLSRVLSALLHITFSTVSRCKQNSCARSGGIKGSAAFQRAVVVVANMLKPRGFKLSPGARFVTSSRPPRAMCHTAISHAYGRLQCFNFDYHLFLPCLGMRVSHIHGHVLTMCSKWVAQFHVSTHGTMSCSLKRPSISPELTLARWRRSPSSPHLKMLPWESRILTCDSLKSLACRVLHASLNLRRHLRA